MAAGGTWPGMTSSSPVENKATRGRAATVSSAKSDLVGLGVRYLFSPDDWGAAVEISYGYRFTRATFSDGAAYKADAPGLLRLAAGVDIRTGRLFALTPMVVATVGSYSDVTVQRPGGVERNVLTETTTTGYVGASLGGSFDLFSKWE